MKQFESITKKLNKIKELKSNGFSLSSYKDDEGNLVIEVKKDDKRYGHGIFSEDEMCCLNISVDPDRQRQGIASWIYDTAEETMEIYPSDDSSESSRSFWDNRVSLKSPLYEDYLNNIE